MSHGYNNLSDSTAPSSPKFDNNTIETQKRPEGNVKAVLRMESLSLITNRMIIQLK